MSTYTTTGLPPAKLGVETSMPGKHRSKRGESTGYIQPTLNRILDGSIDHFISPQRASHITVYVTSTAEDRQATITCLPLRRTSILRLFLLITSLVTGCHPIVLGDTQSSELPYCAYANVIGIRIII